jgi:adenylate kinase
MAEAQIHMEHGRLVPDTTVLMLVQERGRCLQCRGGFMLDGFPRTLAQAEALDAMLEAQKIPLDAVIDLELPDEKLIARLSGRRVCPKCKAVFHIVTQQPRIAGVCDACGGPLVQRPDDHPESVGVRLDAYHAATEPLVGHYRAQGRLVTVDADAAPETVFARTLDALAALDLDG